jgi:L-alanine-DL-glutamate epimerase-like enolase superfamily enzyme
VAQMLGATRDAVAAYGSSMRRNITTAEESGRLVRLRDEQGYRAFKLHTGHDTPDRRIAQLVPMDQMVPAVRAAIGDSVDLLVDVNGCYDAEQAIDQRSLLVDHNVCLFEEPCPNWELEWTAQVREAMPMTVAGGEQDYDLKQWDRIVDLRCVDLAQPDICYIGGLTRAMRVARLVEDAGMTCIPHSANVSMVTIFALHMLAAIPNAGPWLEFSIEDTPWAKGIFDPALVVVDGQVKVPDGPGWGVTIRPEWLGGASRQVSELT